MLQALLALNQSHPSLLSPRWRAETLQDRLNKALDRYPQLENAAATLIVADVTADHICLWYAGDSRGYRVTAGRAMPLTHDHTTLNVLIADGQLTVREADGLADTSFARALDNVFVYSH